MTNNANRLPDEWQDIFINRIRSVGVWCDGPRSGKYRHFFVCRNPKASVAISLCGQLIISFEKLHENLTSQKCLICDLYETGSKEVKQRILERHDSTLEQTVSTQNPNQE